MGLQRDRVSGPWRILSFPRVYSRVQDALAVSRSRVEFADRYVRARKDDWVLDVGCGPADILQYLPDVEYVGVDRDAGYVAVAERRYADTRPRARFAQMDVAELTSTWAGRFDLILAQGVLHHLDDTRVLTLLSTIRSLLKSEGRFVAVDPASTADQGMITHLLLAIDRGRFVRSPESYRALARQVFSDVEPHIRRDLMRLPYTHFIMECAR